MLKVNNKDTRTSSLMLFTPCYSVSIADFEHVFAGWDISQKCAKFLNTLENSEFTNLRNLLKL